MISAVLLVGWLLNKDKRWSRQSALLVAFLVVMVAGVPLAANTFSAFWSLYGMATVLLCICLPLPSLVTSVRKVRVWIYTFVAVAFYVGTWAVFNGRVRSVGRFRWAGRELRGCDDGNGDLRSRTSRSSPTKRRLVKTAGVVSILVFLGSDGRRTTSPAVASSGSVPSSCTAWRDRRRKWIGLVVIAADRGRRAAVRRLELLG